jgi:hypothetical protein
MMEEQLEEKNGGGGGVVSKLCKTIFWVSDSISFVSTLQDVFWLVDCC